MNRLPVWVFLVLLLGVCLVSAYAATPMDVPMLSVRTFFQTIFAPLAIIALGIIGAIALGMFTTAPGSVVIMLVVLSLITALLASIANGSYLMFLGVV